MQNLYQSAQAAVFPFQDFPGDRKPEASGTPWAKKVLDWRLGGLSCSNVWEHGQLKDSKLAAQLICPVNRGAGLAKRLNFRERASQNALKL